MSADDPGSITRWLDGLKAGQPAAADAIWRRYYERVVAVARQRLQSSSHQVVEDGEDVALSAFQDLSPGRPRASSIGSAIAPSSGGSWPPSP